MSDQLRCTLIQTELIWEDVNANLQALTEKVLEQTDKSDLIILPEMFTTGFTMNPEELAEPMNGSTVDWMKVMAFEIVEVNGWKIMPMICYDLRFPVWSRMQEPNEYDVLVYVANWPKPRVAAWDTLLRARAIENQAYCIGINRVGVDGNDHEYVGHSGVYDFGGNTDVPVVSIDLVKFNPSTGDIVCSNIA